MKIFFTENISRGLLKTVKRLKLAVTLIYIGDSFCSVSLQLQVIREKIVIFEYE